jgi:CheY-like chemotaxis protein
MPRVCLIHWKAAEADERAARLRAAGHTCDLIHDEADVRAALKSLMEDPPSAVVIDLSRLPSQGRDVALLIRTRKSTRHVPLVFVEGDADKVARVKEALPDVVYTSWSRIRSSLKKAIAEPPEEPVVPRSAMAGYAGAPLLKKLGIKENIVVTLVGAPDGFEAGLGELPPGAVLRRRLRGRCDLVLCFVRNRKELARAFDRIQSALGNGGVWMIWPKKSSPMAADVSQNDVRKAGLAAGLVDYKICAIDANWSGLRFTRRQ